MIFNTEKQIKEFNEKLTEDEKNSLTELVEKLKDSHKTQDLDKIKVDMEAITTRWNEISTRIYSQSASQTPPTDGGQEPPVQDVDFENVK
jgi:molecular chaperone DnaK